MDYTLPNIRRWIAEYVSQNPGGRDVTAYVLQQIGQHSLDAFCRATRATLDQAKQQVGSDVKRLLFEMYPASKQLEQVLVDKIRWPLLAPWVTSYTTYDIVR